LHFPRTSTHDETRACAAARLLVGVPVAAPNAEGAASGEREPLSVARDLVCALAAFGIDTVFGIPGGAISALYAALAQDRRLRVVTARQETQAVFLAMGYARATGRPGVVVTTAGPGLTNALTGMASAAFDHVPLVVISGEVPRKLHGLYALQEGSAHTFDAARLAGHFAASTRAIARPEHAVPILALALRAAVRDRVCSFLSLPLDIGTAAAGRRTEMARPADVPAIDRAACAEAFEALAQAERPLILCGAGARDHDRRRVQRRRLVELAERSASPVATTPKGKGVFPEDHPLALGVMGFGGHESVLDYLRGGIDVLLVLGSSLNDFATNAFSPLLRPSRALVQVDVDAERIGRTLPASAGIVGTIEDAAAAMLAREVGRRSRSFLPRIVRQTLGRSERGALSTAEVVETLGAECPQETLYTADMGEHLGVALHYLTIPLAGDFYTALGFGSMGSGVVFPIGYQLADPQRPVVAIVGDGGFAMCGSELLTAVRYGLRTTFVVINDADMNMCTHGIRDQYGVRPDFTTPRVDFAAAARAYGAAGYSVETRDELLRALREATDGPKVLDVRIDPNVRLLGSPRVAALKQFAEGSDGAPDRL
jgi:acetolactate synthase-1/2/3 large subunit